MFRFVRLTLALVCLAAPAFAAPPSHPMDAFSSAEHWTIREVLRAAGKLEGDVRFVSVDLHEPPKAEVLAWKPGAAFRREAVAVLTQGTQTFEAIVDVAGQKLVSWREVPGLASLVSSEQAVVGELAASDPRMIAGFKKRGIVDLETVRCYGLSPGYFGTKEEEGKRLALARCWDRRGVYNTDGRPIEGLYAYVDVVAKKVLRVVDGVAAPVPHGPVDLEAEVGRRAARGPRSDPASSSRSVPASAAMAAS